MDSPKISVVIPSYRSRDTIGAALECIRRQRKIALLETLVVDSSGDGTGEWIGRNYPDVRVISSPVRLWSAAARNRGAEAAAGSVLAFLDTDARAAPDWLATLYDKLMKDPSIGAIGGAVGTRATVSLPELLLHWIEFSEFLPGLPSGFRSHLPSCNLLVRRDDFLQSGGFDESFRMLEDWVFCDRMEGGKYFDSRTSVIHRGRTEWNRVLSHLRSLGYWSGLYRSTRAVEGAWLADFPAASAALPLLRWWRILRRASRSSPVTGLAVLILSPFLWLGLAHWTFGFYRGLRSGEPE